MSMFQRLLLIPCLAPLLALLVLSATSAGDKTRIRLLVWTTPPLPLGAWTAMAGVGGAAGAAVAAFLVSPLERPLIRQRRSPVQPELDERDYAANASTPRSSANHGPERDVRDPAPTVSVAYRVIQRPSSAPQPPEASAVASPLQDFGDWGDDPEADW
ncbi:hypothetical protein FZX09_02920 [Synechococcus sp. MU1643]|uniref:hypothetical protein n=1 Tax=Synechococcus sp. MU1643 TaxID=2508349 RepID=UPI001CF8D6AC|nr:hypothetical protein [Synechococcus sp. MU1643]MCB4427767.1 hypothetical protein [Synechococcus sp. MU1643]